MNSHSRAWAIAGSLLLTGTLAACGSTSSGSTGGYGYSSGSTSASVSSSAPASQSSTVATASSKLGTILVDGKGMTLYLFTKDTQGSGRSTCSGACLAAWPPVTGTPTAGAGVDKALLGTLTRSDSTTQATYNGWPLYYWAGDSAAGDTNGQGVQQVWWVLDPAGNAIMK